MQSSFLQILKFIIAILLVPVIIAVTHSFHKEISSLSFFHRHAFNFGILAYVIMQFFLFSPRGVYDFGQRLMNEIFRFFGPATRFVTHIVPIYTVLILMFYNFVSLFAKLGFKQANICVFFMGLTLAMHLIFTAQNLREEDTQMIKAKYLFSMTWIYICNLSLIALLFDLVVDKFSFSVFTQNTIETSQLIYRLVFRQVFS